MIARHREYNLDLWWPNALRLQLWFNNLLVRQLAMCAGFKYAIANDLQPSQECLGCVIGKDERGRIYEWPDDVLCINVITTNEIRADNDGRVARYIGN